MSLHSCIFNRNGLLKCWGNNLYGKLGLGDENYRGDEMFEMGSNLTFVEMGDGLKVDQVSTGGDHTCVHLTNNKVRCWGNNGSGRLGLGISDYQVGHSPETIPKNLNFVDLGTNSPPTQVVCGSIHTCVLFKNMRVKCFGANDSGQIGYEGINYIGSQSSDMGDNLDFVNLGTDALVEVISTSGSSFHNCIILSGTQLMKCWGNNDFGQLGYNDDSSRGKDPNTLGDYLLTLDLGAEARVNQISVGDSFTCALRIDDQLKCWGGNSYGQIGIASTEDRITTMGVALLSTPYDSGKKIKQMSAGVGALCLLYDDSITVKCIGYNDNGGLGQGDTDNRGDSPTTIFPNIQAIDLGTGNLQISSIKSYFSFNCIEFVDQSLKCFGYGSDGSLGYGNIDDIGDEPNELGVNLPFLEIFEKTTAPTKAPTPPTESPTSMPTSKPTKLPTKAPTFKPIIKPTDGPTTKIPTNLTPTSKPTTISPTNKPATISPTISSKICNYNTKKSCKKDESCSWKKKKCAVFDCTKYLERSKCVNDARCDWKKGECRLQPK